MGAKADNSSEGNIPPFHANPLRKKGVRGPGTASPDATAYFCVPYRWR